MGCDDSLLSSSLLLTYCRCRFIVMLLEGARDRKLLVGHYSFQRPGKLYAVPYLIRRILDLQAIYCTCPWHISL